GAAGSRVDLQSRLHGRAGHRAGRSLLLHERQPPGRPGLRLARPADLIRMSNAPAIVAAQEPTVRARVAMLALVRPHRKVAAAALLVAFLFLIAILSPVIWPHHPLARTADTSYPP